jgi:calcineurin-like phosphoesterase family protein
MDLECGIKDRPSDDEQIRRINAKCGRKDTLIILGDVGNIDCVRRLRAAHKVLIMGNHDAGRTNYERVTKILTFDKTQCSKEQLKNALTLKYPGWKIDISEEHNDFHSPFDYWAVKLDNCLFDEVYEGALIVGEKLILSHEPIMGLTWAMNLHGHVHDKRAKTDAYHINCCSDVIGYEPINLTQKLKQGIMSRIVSIHRQTIDKATERKARRRTHSTNTVKNC